MENQKQNTAKSVNEKELETLAFWQANKIFEKTVETPAGEEPKGDFSFYDGPPFATGLPHHGSLMAGTVKDLIPRFQSMNGMRVRRVWGWDCHGLPVENLIEKKLALASKKDIESYGIDKFNHEAMNSVLQYDAEWKKIIPRMGRWVDMEHPYKTMDTTYTESVWWSFGELYKKGLVYEGNKMMHICPRCETPLAQSEVGLEYNDVTDLSVTAKFELVDEPGTYVLAWTTTPWTLPGNTALAVNKELDYVRFKINEKSLRSNETSQILNSSKEGEMYITSRKYFENDLIKLDAKKGSGNLGIGDLKETSVCNFTYEIFEGDDLIGKSYKPVFPYFLDKKIENKENIWKIWHADFISEDAGTGIAHEAPAFGAEDMELAKANSIPVIKHVKMDGTFTAEVTDFSGMKVKVKDDTQSADIEIIKYLAHHGHLFEKHKIVHSYPLCWRCKTPLLNYATSSWFVDIPKIKDKLVSENKNIGWTPEHVRDGRFGRWLEGAREWAVSRLRYWGAPLPVWRSESGKIKVISSLKELSSLTILQPKNSYFVIRHGQSVYNTQKKLDSLGVEENILTEEGREMIASQKSMLKELGIDVVLSSPLPRTRETASILTEDTEVSVIAEEKLREFAFGEFEGKNSEEFHRRESLHLHLDEKVVGGDSFRNLAHRFMKTVSECEAKFEGKKILFVTHGSNGYMGRAEAELWTDEEIVNGNDELTVHNGEIIPIHLKLVPRDATGAINLHRPYIDDVVLQIDGEVYKRIPDVFDCWYESGSMPYASLHYPFENKEVFERKKEADFIAESMDQTRGWFYSLINLGVGLFDKAPYKHVICNGFINALDGKKLSKSLQNYTDPLLLVEKFGADAFRYYLMSSPVVKGEGVNFNDKELEDVHKKVIGRLENVVTLYSMNAHSKVIASADSTNVLDKWIITLLHNVVGNVTRAYEAYRLDDATRPIDSFIDNLSVWYVRRSRDRLKGALSEDDKRESLATLKYVLLELSKIIAPVMPFLGERIYQEVGGLKESVHLEKWPDIKTLEEDGVKIMTDMGHTRDLASSLLMQRTKAGIAVRQPLASVTLNYQLNAVYLDIIKDEVNVKEVIINESMTQETSIDTTMTPELIREGDIRNLMRAVQDNRKEKGMKQGDLAELILSIPVSEEEKNELSKVCNLRAITMGKDLENKTKISLSFGDAYFAVIL